MATTQATLQGKDTTAQGGLYSSFELGDKQWKITASDGKRNASRHNIDAGDTAAVADCLRKAKARFGLPENAKVHSCYEAGRDGWWLHRWLLEHGVDNIVVDSASIEVNRRARRAKNDRLDGDKLLAMLLRWHAGERRLWSVLKAPTMQQEDARRVDRELDRLTSERTAHLNRIGSLLVMHNFRPGRIGGRTWGKWWNEHKQDVPPALSAEIERELERLALVKRQVKLIEASKKQELAHAKHPLVAMLSQLRSIGTSSAWKLDKELFGWRQFNNRRQVAASVGLTPTPYDSGGSQVEQGISECRLTLPSRGRPTSGFACCRPPLMSNVSRQMKRLLVALAMSFSAATSASPPQTDAAVWATATSTHSTNGRVIVFRYVKDFRAGFEKSSLPERVILVWRYESNSGLPVSSEREAMDRLEDLLAPVVEKPGFAMLALVSTGENLREWVYYTKSEEGFLRALNGALAQEPRFPVEVHAAPDPKWSTYERFRQGVRE